jgi:hypothetical protein
MHVQKAQKHKKPDCYACFLQFWDNLIWVSGNLIPVLAVLLDFLCGGKSSVVGECRGERSKDRAE